MARMTPCPGCARHVRSDTCPFCGHAVVALPKGAPLPSGLSRGAILAAVLTAAACAENSAYAPVAVYGAPAPGTDPPSVTDAGSDASEAISVPIAPPVALYGAPYQPPIAVPDAGAPAPVVDAGAKPVKDAGGPKKRPDPGGGTMAPMYGVPPGD